MEVEGKIWSTVVHNYQMTWGRRSMERRQEHELEQYLEGMISFWCPQIKIALETRARVGVGGLEMGFGTILVIYWDFGFIYWDFGFICNFLGNP